MKRRKKEQTGGAAAAVQVRERGGHPFAALRGYMPLGGADAALYRSVREAVPIVDAAIGKLVRLSGGFRVLCEDERAQEELGEFLRTVNVGHAQVGFNAFLDKYLDSLLTNGRAVGEIVPDAEGREIAAVLCHRVEQLALREGETALDVRFCGYDAAGRLRELPRQELVLFTPLLPESENPYGVSLLRSMPFMAELLSRIYYAVGQNWERCGNVRFAVVYKPQGEEPDGALARERAELLAQEWSGAMQETRGGSVRDFVSVGDVSIRAIGADNVMPDCEVPVRQILEQLVAKTGLPPFLLGLSWSSTAWDRGPAGQFQQLLQLLLGHGGPGQCPLPLRQHCRHREPHPQPQLLDLAPPVLRQGHHPAPQAQGQDPRRLLHAGFSLRHQPVHLRLTHPMRTGPRLFLLFV